MVLPYAGLAIISNLTVNRVPLLAESFIAVFSKMNGIILWPSALPVASIASFSTPGVTLGKTLPAVVLITVSVPMFTRTGLSTSESYFIDIVALKIPVLFLIIAENSIMSPTVPETSSSATVSLSASVSGL